MIGSEPLAATQAMAISPGVTPAPSATSIRVSRTAVRPEPLDMAFVVAHRSSLSRRVRTFITWAATVLSPYLD